MRCRIQHSLQPVVGPSNVTFSSHDPGVPYTQNDVVKTKLLSLLLVTGSPLFMFDAIMKWSNDAQLSGYNFATMPPKRTTYLNDLR